jgi:hypothetical protein
MEADGGSAAAMDARDALSPRCVCDPARDPAARDPACDPRCVCDPGGRVVIPPTAAGVWFVAAFAAPGT